MVTTPAQGAPTHAGLSDMEELFMLDAESTVETLEGLSGNIFELDDSELDLYVITVHGIKSALANIGQTALSADALTLEKAGDARDFALMAAKTPALIDALKGVLTNFRAVKERSEGDMVTVSGESAAYLRDTLLGIKAACDTLDKDAAKAALNELKQKTWPPPVADALNDIVVCLLHSEFKTAANLAEKTANMY